MAIWHRLCWHIRGAIYNVNLLTIRDIHMIVKFLLFVPVLYLAVLKSHANTTSMDELKNAVTDFVKQDVQTLYPNNDDYNVVLGYLDSQMNLTSCAHHLSISKRHGEVNQGRLSLDIRCESPTAWKISLPVQVQIFKTVAVSSELLSKGKIIQLSDIALIRQNITTLSQGYYENPNDIIGKVISRPISQGTLIRPSMIQEAVLVKRGSAVNIVSQGKGIRVQALGIAMQDGIKGQTVTVKNKASNLTVEGEVLSSDTVVINL